MEVFKEGWKEELERQVDNWRSLNKVALMVTIGAVILAIILVVLVGNL